MRVLVFIFSAILPLQILAQSDFEVFNQTNLDSTVRTNFIKQGQCANVFNIKSIGAAGNVGTFRGGADLLRMDSGIVFSTGFLNNIATRNTLPDNTGQLNQGSDPDLQRIASRTVQDAVGIEFDFIPNADVVTFDYVFASEEYCEFVDDIFNDVFGFFASGPGINGEFGNSAINVAVVPNTQEKVSINTVNHKTNEALYVSNLTPIDAAACNLPFNPNDLKRIEFDGYTVRMRATINVIPCQVYHLRLVVGDVADDILDSGVFLAANSFDLGTAVDVTSWVGDTLGDTFYENCLDAKYVFTKNIFTRDTFSQVFNYTISGTATPGVDFEALPGRIRIAANQATAEVPIRVLSDDIRESVETIILVVEFFSCDCIERDTSILYLVDEDYDFDINIDDAEVCQSQAFHIGAQVVGGAAPFRYQWSSGDTTPVVALTLDTATTLSVVIQDFCGARDSTSTSITFKQPPEAEVIGEPFFCESNGFGVIDLSLGGQAPWSLGYEQNGEIFEVNQITQSPFSLIIGSGDQLTFWAFTDRFCTGTVPQINSLTVRQPQFTIALENPSCIFANDGLIEITLDEPVNNYVINWEHPGNDEFKQEDLFAGRYRFVISDEFGCSIADSVVLQASLKVESCRELFQGQVYIPNAFSPNGDGINDDLEIFPHGEFISKLSFALFNRWGNRVFQSREFAAADSASHVWDGGDFPSGTYVLAIHLILSDQSTLSISEDVTLIR